jgi:hypothetical protein
VINRLLGNRCLSLGLILLGLARSGLAVAPTNDTCAGVVVIPSGGPFPYYTPTVNVLDATTTGDPALPSCRSVSVGRSVWYSFTPSVTRLYTISASKDTATTVLDTVMAIYTSSGECNGTFAQVHCNDDLEEETRSAISATLNANVTYYIVVWMSSLSPPVGGLTSAQLRVSAPVAPANDNCFGAEIITAGGPFPYLSSIADTTLATTTGEPSPSCWVDPVRSVWFRFTPVAADTYEFSLCTNTATTVYETVLAIYASANGCNGPFMEVACNHTNACSNKPRSTFTVSLAKDMTYYIVAWAGLNAAYTLGETSLQLRVAPFQPPIAVTLPASSITSTSAALNAMIDPNGLASVAWFEWGTTTSYGLTTAPINLPVTTDALWLAAGISGLQRGQTYHFRVVASNSASSTRGADRSFAWSSIPPRIISFSRTNGTNTLQLLGQTGQTYLIEASANLTHWTNLGNADELVDGNFTFADAPNLPSRFYRARAP